MFLKSIIISSLNIMVLTALAQTSQTHYEELKVSIRQLHVNVVDKKGNPITGLTKDDFIIKLNGKEQPVDSVFPISMSNTVTQGSGVRTSSPAIPEMGRRLFLFMFDTQYNIGRDISNARDEVLKFVNNDMLPNDLAAVFTLNKRQIRMVANFTSDKDQLRRSLATFGAERFREAVHLSSGYFARDYWERQEAISKDSFNKVEQDTASYSGLESLFAIGDDKFGANTDHEEALQQLDNLIRDAMQTSSNAYMSQFKQFGEMLSVIKGRKNLVLLSASFSGSLALGENTSRNPSSPMGDRSGLHSGVTLSAAEALIDALKGSGTVVFAIDTTRTINSQKYKNNLHMLNNFSASTGGRMFYNMKDLGVALQKIKTLTNDYYLVNIRPNLNLPKGELASVKVDVKRPKAKVYASKGLLLEPDFQRLSEMERKLMLSEYVARDIIALPIPMEMDVALVPNLKDSRVRLNVAMQIEGNYLLNHSDPMQPTELEIFALAVDRKTNTLVDQDYHTFGFIPQDTKDVLEKTGLAHYCNLFVKPGKYKVKLVVRNLANGHTASLIKDMDVTTANVGGPLQLSMDPWLTIDQDNADVEVAGDNGLQLSTPEEEATLLSFPFKFKEAQFLPTADHVIKNGQARLVYLIDGEQANVDGEKVGIAALVADSDGKYQVAPPAAVQFKVFHPEGALKPGGIILALDLSSMNLKSGSDYTLLTRVNIGNAPPVRSSYAFTAEN